MSSASIRDRIEHKIADALRPVALTVSDDSRRHAGHGARMAALAERGAAHGHAPLDERGETHFSVEVVAAAFEGKSRVERHRMVNDLLTDELRERVHALSIRARTPGEAEPAQPSA
jgi:BolA protein